MSRVKLAVAVGLLGAVISAGAVAIAGGGGDRASARLNGFQEVPTVLTDGSGKVKLRINDTARTIDFVLRYEDLEGATVQQAHIHIGARHTAGQVSVFFCGGAKPACPPSPATVQGTITAADVIPRRDQGVETFEDLTEAIRKGITYANVHTDKSPAGEIRGQISAKNGHKGDRGKGRHDNDTDTDD
jgi:hypothetical protein